MKPHKKYILFRPFEGDSVTSGGIYVSDAHRELSNKGEVIAVGNMVSKVKVGQIGFKVKSTDISDWCHPFIIDGVKHFLIHEDVILSTQ
jgi:co-chaperonin GroES (HSP10)